MATRTTGRPRTAARLDKADVLDIYKTMLLARRIDDKEIQLKRQNKIFFQISAPGHEGLLAATSKVLRPAYDWFYTYYRDRALCLAYDAGLRRSTAIPLRAVVPGRRTAARP